MYISLPLRRSDTALACEPVDTSCDPSTFPNPAAVSLSSSATEVSGLSHRNMVGILVLGAVLFVGLVLWLCFGRWSKPVRQFCRGQNMRQKITPPRTVNVSFEDASQNAREKEQRGSARSDGSVSPDPDLEREKRSIASQAPVCLPSPDARLVADLDVFEDHRFARRSQYLAGEPWRRTGSQNLRPPANVSSR